MSMVFVELTNGKVVNLSRCNHFEIGNGEGIGERRIYPISVFFDGECYVKGDVDVRTYNMLNALVNKTLSKTVWEEAL